MSEPSLEVVPPSVPGSRRRLLVGPRPLRDIWLKYALPCSPAVIEVPVLDDEMTERLGALTGGLFSKPDPIVVQTDGPVALITTLMTLLEGHNGDVVVAAGKAPVRHRYELVELTTPTTSAAWQRLAAGLGVNLDRPGAELLRRRSGNLATTVSVLELCRLGRITNPTAAQLDLLLVTDTADATPWSVGDHLEHGRLQPALEAAEEAVPLALHAYLARRWMRSLALHEGDVPADHRDRKLLDFVNRVGADSLHRALHVLASSDMLLKQHDHDGLRVMLARLAPLFKR